MPNEKRHGKKRNRTNTHIDPETAKLRRMTANYRERERMNMLNGALEKLRCVLPSQMHPHSKLSKIDTLRMAGQYIHNLSELLQNSKSNEESDESFNRKSVYKNIVFPDVTAPLSEDEYLDCFPSSNSNGNLDSLWSSSVSESPSIDSKCLSQSFTCVTANYDNKTQEYFSRNETN